MIDLADFTPREVDIIPQDVFPNFNQKELLDSSFVPQNDRVKKLLHGKSEDLHQLILDTALAMWDGGYDFMINKFGFYQPGEYQKFKGHCHQITPALGVVLKSLGFSRVVYLECFRVDPKTGEKIDPKEEPDPQMRDEFCGIGRIPYCCLGVEVGGEMFYLTGKHIKPGDNGQPKVILTPDCYRDFVGVLRHPKDSSKSGIYLKVVKEEPFTWQKQVDGKDGSSEFFQAYVKMNF